MGDYLHNRILALRWLQPFQLLIIQLSHLHQNIENNHHPGGK